LVRKSLPAIFLAAVLTAVFLSPVRHTIYYCMARFHYEISGNGEKGAGTGKTGKLVCGKPARLRHRPTRAGAVLKRPCINCGYGGSDFNEQKDPAAWIG
jgi:hypothetical protein